MSSNIAVSVHHVSKTYKLYDKPIDRAKEALHPFNKKYHKVFHALQDISLELEYGKAIGIIGRNGHGKSTLLKIIAGLLTPTTGQVETKGKIAAILELTSNLNQELTGIENILLNLKINGFNKKSEIACKIKEIEEFAHIGEFIRQPIKTYSSGMKSRLGFGIATSLEADILILDEVLSVGDFAFQQKCLAKINGLREKMSIIFVSHSMNSVRLFCDNALVLDKGENVFFGKADDGIKYYLEQEEKKKVKLAKEDVEQVVKPFYGDLFHNKEKIIDVTHYWIDEDENKILRSATNGNIGIYVRFKLLYRPRNLIVGLPIWDVDGNCITGISTEMDNYQPQIGEDGFCEVLFKFNNILNPNKYIGVVSIIDQSETLYRNKNEIFESYNINSRFFGFVNIPHKWTHANQRKVISLNEVKLTVDATDTSGGLYDSKNSFEEINNKLYQEINEKYSPDVVVDVGANYGFMSIVFSKYFFSAKFILIEASPKLINYIHSNLHDNGVENYQLINAICAEISNDKRDFSQNPRGSQDNRVIGENKKWETHEVGTLSLDDIFDLNSKKFHFVKIDTQGYEEKVFAGAERFLSISDNWIIKTEFAPYWLKSQKTQPKVFLKYLIDKYIVCEAPGRSRCKGDDLQSLISNRLSPIDIDHFLEYVTNYNKNERGWCDLYVFPLDFKVK